MEYISDSKLTLVQGEPVKKLVYEAPAIVYEGFITARAGTPEGLPDSPVDPADLFGNGK